ncbi:MAG: hypothetical protein K6G31_00060 [Paludibacteraceae bacterium]|nr:hypothetical protein [Paludibacteraceae bacterium]
MKKYLFPIGILALSAGLFSSCNDDEDDDNNNNSNNTFTYVTANQKRLVKTSLFSKDPSDGTYGSELITNYKYDSFGRLTKENNSRFDRELKYNGYDVTGSYYSFASENGDIEEITGKLNAYGYLDNLSYAIDESLLSTVTYTYDNNKHLTSIKQTFFSPLEGERTYGYSWENGNLTKMTDIEWYEGQPTETKNHTYTYLYTNNDVETPIENKYNIPLIEHYETALGGNTALRALSGLASKQLPVSIKRDDGEVYNFDWTLDKDGYPIEVISNDKKLVFTWE